MTNMEVFLKNNVPTYVVYILYFNTYCNLMTLKKDQFIVPFW